VQKAFVLRALADHLRGSRYDGFDGSEGVVSIGQYKIGYLLTVSKLLRNKIEL
jgi:hypothetical protein